jgi:hypothetical protein
MRPWPPSSSPQIQKRKLEGEKKKMIMAYQQLFHQGIVFRLAAVNVPKPVSFPGPCLILTLYNDRPAYWQAGNVYVLDEKTVDANSPFCRWANGGAG